MGAGTRTVHDPPTDCSAGRARGMAHTWHHTLQSIIGGADWGRQQPELRPSLARDRGQIQQAALRAAALGQTLQAFSAGHVLERRALTRNELLLDLSTTRRGRMPQGVAVSLVTRAERGMGFAEPARLRTVGRNLAANARDVMPASGTLTLDTCHVTLAAGYCSQHPRANPGEAVCLLVSDRGGGMDSATLARIFAPFFTTKETGRKKGRTADV